MRSANTWGPAFQPHDRCFVGASFTVTLNGSYSTAFTKPDWDGHRNELARNRVFANAGNAIVLGDANTITRNRLERAVGNDDDGSGDAITLDAGRENMIADNVVDGIDVDNGATTPDAQRRRRQPRHRHRGRRRCHRRRQSRVRQRQPVAVHERLPPFSQRRTRP